MPLSGIVLTLVALVSLVAAQSVDSYVTSEKPVAKANLLANIGANGAKSAGAKPGIVIASPQTDNPDYLFYWLRDGSLVFKYIVDEYVNGRDNTLLSHITDFVSANSIIQGVDNPSGTAASGLNLGEPKYEINETAFTGPWGRPQRDGPALRITVLTTFANFLLSQSNTSYVTNTLWPIIQKDANYVSNNWNQTTFDLWEETDSSSFFTTAVQHRALREAIALGNKIGQTSSVSAWSTQASNLLCFLQTYWSPNGNFVTANTSTPSRSGVDANTVLASIHTFDPNAGCDATTFQPCSDKALINLMVYVNMFRTIYAINSGVALSSAAGVGRYKEDVYMGGNPWYLATFAVAEQLYLALNTWSSQGSLTITSISLPFFRLFSSSVSTGTFASTTSTYSTLVNAIKAYADGFVALNAKFTPSNGGLAEQYSKDNGSPLSAADLTWSYASALTAFNARSGLLSNSWGAKGLTVAAACQRNAGPTVSVTFNAVVNTTFGENVFVTGSVFGLSNWEPSYSIAMSAANFPTWSVTVTLPANTAIQYKYIRKETDGSIQWESDPNNAFTTPASGSTTRNDNWR